MVRRFSAEDLIALFRAHRLDVIISHAKQFSKANPKNHDVMTILGIVYQQKGFQDASLDCFRQAARLAPQTPEMHNNLGNALRSHGLHEAALDAFDKAISLRQDYAQAHNGRGAVLSDLGAASEAANAYERVLALQPDNLMAMRNLGQVLTQLGQLDAARESFSKVLSRNPNDAEAHYHFSSLKRYTSADDNHINQMKQQLAVSAQDARNTVMLGYGLGKASADLKDTAAAFDYWKLANTAFRKQIGYSFRSDAEIFNTIRRWNDTMPVLKHTDDAEETPVFILGMPRSGTSLVEQILAGHSQVHAAGELDFLQLAIKRHCLEKQQLSMADLKAVRAYYRQALNRINTGKAFVTDKMPLNFRWIGLIRAMFPEAPIIHLKRHPMAVCFSNFRYFFQSQGMRYSNDLEDIGRYYLHYDQLMQLFHDHHGDAIITVDYAQLTENPESMIRDLLATLGLEWQENCLRIETNQRAVSTASSIQIRNKIYTKSSEEWKNYEHQLEPLLNMLEPVLKRDGWH